MESGEREEMMKGLSVSSALLECYLEETSRGLLLVDLGGSISFVNQRLWELLGIPSGVGGEVTSFARFLELMAGSWPEVGTPLAATARTLARSHAEVFPFKEADKQIGGRWLAIMGRPLEGQGYALTVTDVSQHREMLAAVERASRVTVMALAELGESRDSTTGDHVLRVARLSYEIARKLGEEGKFPQAIPPGFPDNLALASILHDIGKVTTPDAVLLKPGPLDAGEREVMQEHARVGHEILIRLNDFLGQESYLALAASIARSHHEKFGGGGYPDGLTGEGIPLEGRIVALADVFDALISERPYKRAWSLEKAVGLIRDEAGRSFDPQVVEAFLAVQEEREHNVLLTWQEEMSVGNPLLDFDHKNLLGLFNQIITSSDPASDSVIYDLVVQQLYNYTLGHFQREETYLSQVGYPALAHHAQMHRALAAQVLSLRRKILAVERGRSRGELAELLRDWLRQHILMEDAQYARFVRQVGEEDPVGAAHAADADLPPTGAPSVTKDVRP